MLITLNQSINSNPFGYSPEDKLQIVENLPHIVLKRLNQLLQSTIFTCASFLGNDFFESFGDLHFIGLEELDIKAMVGQWSYLLAGSIVTNTDNWYLTILYHLNYWSNSSPISWTHPVNLIHYDQRFLQIFGSIYVVRPTLQQSNSAFITDITCIELAD